MVSFRSFLLTMLGGVKIENANLILNELKKKEKEIKELKKLNDEALFATKAFCDVMAKAEKFGEIDIKGVRYVKVGKSKLNKKLLN